MLTPMFKVQLSKSFTNFTTMSHRMKQQSLWTTDQCRCCIVNPEADTFHIFHYRNKILAEEKTQIFNKLFFYIARWETDEKVKELVFQVLTGNEDYVPPEELVLVYNDLALLGLQNLWYSFLPLSLLDLVDKDIILSRRKVV